ncbi:MAG: hypothetical protein HY873_00350 [Chloroflexi bacterium]|nr:hypothetical protein [Chloroflexota bacterium]
MYLINLAGGGGATIVTAFNVTVSTSELVLMPTAPACLVPKLNCNPDFNEGVGGTGWSCDPVVPDQDVGGAVADSIINCSNAGGDTPGLIGGASMRLFGLDYASVDGGATISLKDASLYDETATEIMSCNPVVSTAGACNNAQVVIGSLTPTPTPSPTPSPTNTPTPFSISTTYEIYVDCDPVGAGIQSVCPGVAGLQSVDVVLANYTGQAARIAAFNFNVRVNQNVAVPLVVTPCTGSKLNCNPDFNEGQVGLSWSCDPVSPDQLPADPGIATSWMACVFAGGYPMAPGAFVKLADVDYAYLGGSTLVEIHDVNVYDVSVTELLSCSPAGVQPGGCNNALFSATAPTYTPTNTPTITPTFTVTNTPTITPTYTPTNTPTMTPTDTPTPSPTPTDTPTNTPTNTPADTPTFTPTPTATPCPDQDCDGVADPSDNCLSIYNPDQLNSDGNFIDNSPPFAPGTDDRTRVNSDNLGDACDPDDDNDGLLDTAESAAACAVEFGATDPTVLDTDGDRFADGAECVLGSDPTNASSVPPFLACGSTEDTDGDRLSDRIETCKYNSDPESVDTDGDLSSGGAKDGCEAASVNGDRIVTSGDQLLLALEMIREIAPAQRLVNFDINKDGVVSSGDQLILAQFMMILGVCP